MSGRLFVCATPIGNLEDVTHRLLRVLAESDVIAAEDTRRTRKLLSHFGISSRLVSYHEGNERQQTVKLVEQMRGGAKVALVTDSGTPTISDPGYRLVRACVDTEIPMEIVPGPSAVVAALAISGLATDRFIFEGFLPRKQGDLRRRLEELSSDVRTLILFEAPTRVIGTLQVIEEVLGNRRMALARELTKSHEEVRRGRVSEVLETLVGEKVLGEIVLVVEGGPQTRDLTAAQVQARRLVASGMSKSRAAAEAARRFSVARRSVYEALTGYSGEKGSHDD